MSVDFQIGILFPVALLLCWIVVQISRGKGPIEIIKIFIDKE